MFTLNVILSSMNVMFQGSEISFSTHVWGSLTCNSKNAENGPNRLLTQTLIRCMCIL